MNKLIKSFLIAAFLFPCFNLTAQVSDGVKYENVMAVYMFNFTKFLEWTGSDQEYFNITVLGKSKITEPLRKIAEKENVSGKKIIVGEIKDIGQLKKCNMLFISTDDEDLVLAIIKKTAENKLLTVSNAKGFAEKGVCINFIMTEEKMKFEINRRAIEKTGIVVNSRLLSLAVKVYN